MLIINGVSYNINEKFIRVYNSKNILLFWLIPYITYLLSLRDVVYFQTLKYYHSKRIDNIIQDRSYEFSKLEFLAQITYICL